MKKRKIIIGSAAAFTAAATMGSCGIFESPQPTLYGPPSYFDEEEKTGTTDKGTDTSAATSEIIPSPEDVQAVYGPPNYFEEETTVDETSGNNFEPEDNVGEDIYGPPEMFGLEEEYEEEETEVTTENTFAEEENTAAPLYGPPEMFGIEDTENTDEQVTTDDR